MANKKVSSKYALHEFKIIGLILILYCILVLFYPLVLNYFFEIYTFGEYGIIDLDSLSIALLMIAGTVLPFAILRNRNKPFNKKTQKIKASFKDIFIQAMVFFSVTSAAIFAMTSIASYFNVSGQLVSGIGVSIKPEYLNNIVYVITFIFISPILEEYAFRGVLLNTLSKYGKFFALVASSIVFALAHGSFLEFIPSFIMGVILGKIALRYKSIRPTIWIHIIFNITLYILFMIPEELSIYSAIILALIYIISVILYLTRSYKRIIVKKSPSTSRTFSMFIGTYTIIFALILFLIDSALVMIIG